MAEGDERLPFEVEDVLFVDPLRLAQIAASQEVGEMVADDLEALAAGREPLRMQRADPLTVDRLRSRPIG